MNLSKSEGVWGNKEAIPHTTKCVGRPLLQLDTQLDNDDDRGKTDHVSEASPPQLPPVKINSLLSLSYLIISYGSGNHVVQNKRVCGSFSGTPPPPYALPMRSIQQKYFPKFWR